VELDKSVTDGPVMKRRLNRLRAADFDCPFMKRARGKRRELDMTQKELAEKIGPDSSRRGTQDPVVHEMHGDPPLSLALRISSRLGHIPGRGAK